MTLIKAWIRQVQVLQALFKKNELGTGLAFEWHSKNIARSPNEMSNINALSYVNSLTADIF